MAHSNILGGDEPPTIPPGHGTADLGPSDSSDSGSDIAGPGLADDAMGLDAGTTSDMERAHGAGPDLGDSELDSDSDRFGTGEHRAAGRDPGAPEAADISPDRITTNPGGMTGGDDPEGIGVSSDTRVPASPPKR